MHSPYLIFPHREQRRLQHAGREPRRQGGQGRQRQDGCGRRWPVAVGITLGNREGTKLCFLIYFFLSVLTPNKQLFIPPRRIHPSVLIGRTFFSTFCLVQQETSEGDRAGRGRQQYKMDVDNSNKMDLDKGGKLGVDNSNNLDVGEGNNLGEDNYYSLGRFDQQTYRR